MFLPWSPPSSCFGLDLIAFLICLCFWASAATLLLLGLPSQDPVSFLERGVPILLGEVVFKTLYVRNASCPFSYLMDTLDGLDWKSLSLKSYSSLYLLFVTCSPTPLLSSPKATLDICRMFFISLVSEISGL